MSRRTQVGFLLAVIVATCLVQALAVSRAAVPALDAVRFANSARAIEELGLLGFLRDHTEPPLFPVSVWTVHAVLVAPFGEFREAWAVSVQWAAVLPLILFPLPVFLLGKRLVGTHAALLGTVFVLCLPELVRLGADGISDSTHLLWFSVALALLVAHLLPADRAQPPVLPALLAGVATALALLTRSEALVLAAAFGVVLLVRTIRHRELPWRSALPYAAGLTLIFAPYGLLLALAHGEPAMAVAQTGPQQALVQGTDVELAGGEKLSFAPKDPTTSIRRRGVAAALLQLADELPKAFGYLPGIFALVGLWILCRRPMTDADLLLQAFCILLLAAIGLHTSREGYLAARHLLPITVAATGCFGVGVQAVAAWLKGNLVRSGPSSRTAPRLAFAMTLVVATICALYGARPLHGSRTGHRSAATWLTQNADRGDRVVDTRGWTGLYSGLATVSYEDSRSEWSRPELRYLVIENRELAYDSSRSRTIRRLLEQAGTQVATFPTCQTGSHTSARVLIYEWNSRGR